MVASASSSGGRLVDILLRRKALSPETMADVRAEAERTGQRIERVLTERRAVSPADMTLAVAEYLGMPPITVARYVPDKHLLDELPRDVFSRNRAAPLARVGKQVTVAMADPFDIVALDNIQTATGLEAVPLAGPEQEITDFLQRYMSDSEAGMESILRDVSEGEVEVGREAREEISLDEMLESAEDAPVIRLVNFIMVEALRRRASDIHIEPMEKSIRLRFRVDGLLYESSSPPKHLQSAITSRIKIMANLNIAERRLPQDGRFRIRALGREADIRVSILPVVYGEKVVMRILDKSALAANLGALGLDDVALKNLRYAIAQPHGMILVTGPTGSGKTTTLYSALAELNTLDVNVVTVEDPVEYQLMGINQVQANEAVGLTFATGLRSILRQDPDIVLVGEIRDKETASIAIQAALTGHLVLSTLHTNDAAGAVARMLYLDIEPFLLASSVVMTQAQRLYRRLCVACRRPVDMPRELMLANHIDPAPFERATFFQARGCSKCNQTGYRGRGAMMEILLVTDEIRDLILRRSNAGAIRDAAIRGGMMTLRDVGLNRVIQGDTTIEEILRVTSGD